MVILESISRLKTYCRALRPIPSCLVPYLSLTRPLPVPCRSGLPRSHKWMGTDTIFDFSPPPPPPPPTTKLFRSHYSPFGILYPSHTCPLPLTYPSLPPPCPLPVPYFYTIELDPIEIRLVACGRIHITNNEKTLRPSKDLMFHSKIPIQNDD